MVVIVIVNWNGTEDTLECLESLMRSEAQNFRVIVIDNGSTISPLAALRKWASDGLENVPRHKAWNESLSGPRRHLVTFEQIGPGSKWGSENLVTLVELGWNSGFAHANNHGIQLALEHENAEFFWLLNNDTIVEPEALSELITKADSDLAYKIIGSSLFYYDEEDVVQGVGASFNRLTARTRQIGNLCKFNELKTQRAVEKDIDFVIGASMFVRRSFVEAAGLMDDRYFLYFEELDWARRLGAKDKLGWSSRSIVHHKEGASIGSDSKHEHSATATYYLNRGLPLFYAKNHPWLLLIAFFKIVFNVARLVVNGRLDIARMAWRGGQAGISAALRRQHAFPKGSLPPHLVN